MANLNSLKDLKNMVIDSEIREKAQLAFSYLGLDKPKGLLTEKYIREARTPDIAKVLLRARGTMDGGLLDISYNELAGALRKMGINIPNKVKAPANAHRVKLSSLRSKS